MKVWFVLLVEGCRNEELPDRLKFVGDEIESADIVDLRDGVRSKYPNRLARVDAADLRVFKSKEMMEINSAPLQSSLLLQDLLSGNHIGVIEERGDPMIPLAPGSTDSSPLYVVAPYVQDIPPSPGEGAGRWRGGEGGIERAAWDLELGRRRFEELTQRKGIILGTISSHPFSLAPMQNGKKSRFMNQGERITKKKSRTLTSFQIFQIMTPTNTGITVRN